jgi:phosphoribosylformimino-5-aminoimidazole carboxamide ribotide isomerase
MKIYPAIDLMNGFCVRLNEGDFNARTNYSADPEEVAQAYKASGAEWLHLIDLDGARDPLKRQKSLITSLARNAGLKIQTGGGIRSKFDVEELLALGASRVIIGSLCVTAPQEAMTILKKHGPEKIVLAFDVRGDFENGFFVATTGWKETSSVRVEDLLKKYAGAAKHIICTDISRDGTLTGPNAALYKRLAELAPDMQFQASGGVAQLSDIDDLKNSSAAGVIIGKALYEKKFTLDEALKRAA